MKSTDPDFIDLLDKQRILEEEVAETLSELLKNIENKVVKLMIHGLILHSMKHADILQALIDVVKGKVFSDVEKFEIDRGFQKHVENEEEMMNRFKEIIDKTEDERIKGILSQIVKEEERHHQELKDIFQLLKNIGNVSEEDWWDYLNKWSNFNF